MNCPNCGFNTDSKYCPECGSPVIQNQQLQNDQYYQQNQGFQQSNQSYQYQQAQYNNSYYNPAFSQVPKKHTGMGITSFILSFLGPLAFAALPLSIIDLAIDKKSEHKHGLAIAGLVISVIVCVFFLLVLITPSNSSVSDARPDTTVTTTGTETIKPDNSTDISDTVSSKPFGNSTTEELPEDVAPTPVETVAPKDEFIASCIDLAPEYKNIARNPSNYIGQNFYLTCYIVSDREGGFLTGYQKYYITYYYDIEEAEKEIKDGWADDYSDAWFFACDLDKEVWLLDNRNENDSEYLKILEGDVVTVYGTFTGMTDTQNSFTNETGEVVSLDIKYVDLISE